MTKYAAQLTYDYSGSTDKTVFNLLRAGLEQLGWNKIGTTSYQIQTNDIDVVWRGLLCMAAVNPRIGDLGSLAVHVSRIDPGEERERRTDALLKIQMEHKLPEIQNLPLGCSSR
jgi:hypothetical protein